MARVWALIGELAVYERLTHLVSGDAASLERHVFDERLCTVFVMEVESEILGYSLSFPTYSTFRTLPGVWLEDLYVTRAERGKGYGKALLNNLIEHCRANNLGRLEWTVLDWNESAIKFYASMGATMMPNWRLCRINFEDGERK